MKKLKILTVFGTRPEVIKLAPLIKAVEADPECISVTCATTQHRELQNNFLDLFAIIADHDLKVMEEGQDLFHITETVLSRIKQVLVAEKPDFTVVQGDTTTAFAAALSCFYLKIPIVHVEAGLRTGNIHYPFPEEANRILISRMASLHMSPTQKAVENLAKEGIIENVFKVGNTIVDSVNWVLKNHLTQNEKIQEILNGRLRNVLITVHRRENFGDPLKEICEAINDLTKKYQDYRFIWPLHPNPNIRNYVEDNLSNIPNLFLLEPLSYGDLVYMIRNSALILSDSGGIQEEACILGKNILILRNETERPEVVEAGYGVLTGSNKNKILENFNKILTKEARRVGGEHIYGTLGVSNQILSVIKDKERTYL
jgi:UDP-N-acetylglucosamine 2-epimerase (non-hydrolysing)